MITTHVLDTVQGRPAAGVPVVLERSVGPEAWEGVGRGETNDDGRLRNLMPDGVEVVPGVYRLVFDPRRYFEAQGLLTFFPQVVIVFEATEGEDHYHVPLLLGPFGYTTYRGS